MMAYEEFSDPRAEQWADMPNLPNADDSLPPLPPMPPPPPPATDPGDGGGGERSDNEGGNNTNDGGEGENGRGGKANQGPGGRRRRGGSRGRRRGRHDEGRNAAHAMAPPSNLPPDEVISLSQEFYGFVLSMVDLVTTQMNRSGAPCMEVPVSDRVFYRAPGGGLHFHEFMFGVKTSPYGGWLSDRDRSPWHAMRLLLPFDKLRRDLVKAKGVYLMVESTNPSRTRVVLHTRRSLQHRKTFIITTSTGRTAMCLNEKPARHTFDIVPW